MSSKCDANGIRVLKFSQPHGPVYHYEQPTNFTFGDQPHIRDPLDKKYVYIDKSTVDFAGEGVYAVKDIPEGIQIVLYGGNLFNNEQYKQWVQNLREKSEANSWMMNDPLREEEFKYQIDLHLEK